MKIVELFGRAMRPDVVRAVESILTREAPEGADRAAGVVRALVCLVADEARAKGVDPRPIVLEVVEMMDRCVAVARAEVAAIEWPAEGLSPVDALVEGLLPSYLERANAGSRPRRTERRATRRQVATKGERP